MSCRRTGAAASGLQRDMQDAVIPVSYTHLDVYKRQVDGRDVRLTPLEYNILLFLVKNQGKVYTINEIYENIWNEEAFGADNTVAVHIRHIREKIEVNPKNPQYLKVVWGWGYKVEKYE